ncbi:leucine-rich repeat-containing protein 20 [Rana temporaria]|uniref:leucine-rich repeat-containing protein 20 n=1 Tax=Rana temporaria TaxID=8407 RepID=UPI001AACF1DE|nr:leucine-rich repeat-containing protein 20 [Rana temporaria]
MAQEAARVARRVNDLIESGGHHFDLSGCCLTAFPTGLILATSSVSDKISSISLANNELKGMAKKFFTTYKNIEELDLQGNKLEKLPVEVGLLPKLKTINLSKNKFEVFPEELTKIQSMESINLESNQIKDIPMDNLNNMPNLSRVDVKLNPVNKESLKNCAVKFELVL